MHTHRPIDRHLSRRDAIRLAAGATATAVLAACGDTAGTMPTPPAIATSGANAVAPTAVTAVATISAMGVVTIPPTNAKLPTEKVNFHWVDSAGEKLPFLKAYFAAYQQAHPNIAVQYEGIPFTEIAKVIPLGIQNGNAPDVFVIPSNFTVAQAVQQGWVRPFDDIVPNFDAWKAAFPPGTFFEGINVFKGKTYSFPSVATRKNNAMLLYNVEYMKQAGLDPQAKPFTWDAYRAAAKKLTQQGAGKYFGVLIPGGEVGRWAGLVRGLGQMAGAVGGPDDINYKTGEYNYTTDQYLGVIDLLLALKADGSVFPGSLSLNALQADAQMPQGVAAMVINGAYMFPQWRTDSPTFAWDVASQPVPNSGPTSPLTYNPGGATWLVYAKTGQPAIAGDMIAYVGSEAGQTAFMTIIGGSQPSVFAKANQAPGIDPLARKAVALFEQQMRLSPSPAVRNTDIALLAPEQKPLTPDFGTVIQGIYTGQLSDPKKAMQDLKDRSDKELERAIKAAQAKGAKVSRDDFIFPNWDPMKDYTEADYTALNK